MKKAKVLLSLVVTFFLLQACNKSDNKESSSSYGKYILGINLTGQDATSQGQLGTPDVGASGISPDSIRITTYPNPALNVVASHIAINSSTAASVTVQLISAIYPLAPHDALVENQDMNGAIMLSKVYTLEANEPPAQGGINPGPGAVFRQKSDVRMDVQDLPRGFYRLVFLFDNGVKAWDNVWLN